MSKTAVVRMPSTHTSSEATTYVHPSWATSDLSAGSNEGFAKAAWKVFSEHRHYVDIFAIAFGASFLPCARDELAGQSLRLVPTHTETPARAPVPIEHLVLTESPFAKIRSLNKILSAGHVPAFSEASLQLARTAIRHLDARASEDVDDWARRIAGDLGARTD
jgi:hypothetical protein